MAKFDVDAARKAGYSDDEILAELTKTSKFDVNRAIQAGYGKGELISHLSKAVNIPAAAPPEPGMGEQAMQMGTDFLRGIGSGVFTGAQRIAQLAEAAGRHKPESAVVSKALDPYATAPASIAGQAGQMLEQGAEFLAPGGLVTRAAGRMAPVLARVPGMARAAPVVARAIPEALAAGGVAGVQSGGDPEAMATAAATGGVLSGAGEAAGAVAPWIRNKAVEQYSRVLNPTKEKTKAITQRIVPELIRRGETAFTMPGMLNRARDRMRFFGQQIDDAWEQMEQQGVTAQVDPILQRLGDVAREHFHVTDTAGRLVPLRGPAEAGLRELQGIAETLQDAATVNPVNGTREIPAATLRSLRQYWDEVADKSGAFTKAPRDLADWARGRASRYGGDAVRAELGAAAPDLAAINREFSFWNRVADVTEQTVARRSGQQKPLTRRIAQLAGAEAGGGGLMSLFGAAAMDQFQALLSSPGWGTISAVMKDRLANAITAGHPGRARFALNQALRAAGMGAVTTRTESAPPRQAEAAVSR